VGATTAMKSWTRLKPAEGFYEILVSENPMLPEPEWPTDLNMAALLRLGFKDKFIDSPDHEVIKMLAGRI
jgi:hypothetical protein